MEGKLVLLTLALFVGVCEGQLFRLNDEQRLTNRLLSITKQTGIYARPVLNASDAIPVSFGIAVLKVLDFKEKDDDQAIVTLQTWHKYTWKNEQLRWDPSNFGGLTTAHFPVDKMWIPDIKLYNGFDASPSEIRDTLAVISSDGNIFWEPQATEKVLCSEDEEIDKWVCHLKYGSWTYDAQKLSLDFFGHIRAFETAEFQASHELELVENSGQRHSKYYACCNEPYEDLTFALKLSRRFE